MVEVNGESNDWTYVLKNMDKVGTLAGLVEGAKDPRKKERVEATEELRKISYDFLTRTDNPDTSQPYIDRNGTPIDEVDQAFLDTGANLAKGIAAENASNRFAEKLDEIVDNQMSKDTLEALVHSKEIAEAASNDDAELLGIFREYKSAEGLLKRYEAGEKLSDEQLKSLDRLAAIGAGKLKADEFERLGYSGNVQQLAAKLAQESVKQGYFGAKNIEEFAKVGLREQIEATKEAYDGIVNDRDRNVHDAVRKSVKTLAKGTGKDFDTAIGLVYGANKKAAYN